MLSLTLENAKNSDKYKEYFEELKKIPDVEVEGYNVLCKSQKAYFETVNLFARFYYKHIGE